MLGFSDIFSYHILAADVNVTLRIFDGWVASSLAFCLVFIPRYSRSGSYSITSTQAHIHFRKIGCLRLKRLRYKLQTKVNCINTRRCKTFEVRTHVIEIEVMNLVLPISECKVTRINASCQKRIYISRPVRAVNLLLGGSMWKPLLAAELVE
jgi:hypothetical protein